LQWRGFVKLVGFETEVKNEGVMGGKSGESIEENEKAEVE